MVTYNSKDTEKSIRQVMDTEFERMYPFELEKALSNFGKNAQENKDEESLKKIRWEFALLNATLGHVTEKDGKKINEISNKWKAILKNKRDIQSHGEVSAREIEHEPEGKTIYLQPLSNLPFCEWDITAVDYYKKRYEETKSNLSKARYAFAVVIFIKSKERLDWMEKCVEGWLKTAETYIETNKYAEYYELPPFAYEFALKLSLSFGNKELAKEVLKSLHQSILKLFSVSEKRWHIEFLEVESNYIHQFNDVQDYIAESIQNIKKRIAELDKSFQESKDKQKSYHFLRHHLKILNQYKIENEYDLYKRIADSYEEEAEAREDPLVRSAFYNDAIKKYKLMQSKFGEKKEEIDQKIEDLIHKIKDINSKIKYKSVQTKFTVKNEQIKSYVAELKNKNPNVFLAFLDDNSLIPRYMTVKEETVEQKKLYPLQFIMPVVIYHKEEPIMKHVTEEKLFDYHVRRNILIGIKMGEIMTKMTFETIKNELKINNLNEALSLIDISDLKDIQPTLNKGFTYIFDEQTDYIAGLHIIVPYIEETIRRIIKKAGKVDVVLQSHNTKFFRGIELGTLLVDEEVGNLINSDFQKVLKILLVDNDQTNLRNELMHGRWESDKIIEGEVLFVAYCLLKLIKVLKEI